MDNFVDLHKTTSDLIDSINFTELNDNWVDHVVENEFTDADENPITISILFVEDVISILKKLSKICDKWIQFCEQLETSFSEDVSFSENSLWGVIQKLDIQIKQVQVLVYLVCSRSLKSSATVDDKMCALAAANFYFSILRVPGSSAYAVFHVNLFCLCLDCLPAPDFISDKSCVSSQDFNELSDYLIPCLMKLEGLVRCVNLGEDSHPVEYVSKKVAELAACEIQNTIKFNLNFSELSKRELYRYKASTIVSTLAYQALLAIAESELNGDQELNYGYICGQLSKHILCFKARKAQTISQKFHTIKDNAVSFICYNLKNKKLEEFCSDVTLTVLKRLCLGVIDKADFRSAISSTVITVLFKLKVEHIDEMLQWLLLLVDSVETKDRVFAVELLGMLLDYTVSGGNSQLPDSLKGVIKEMPIIFAVLTRCDDASPNVRTRALTVLSQNTKCFLQFLEKTKDQETFETEISDEIGAIDFNGNHRFFWYKLSSVRERLNEIANILHRRVEDNNVIARRATLIAFESLMMFDKTYLNPENLKYFDFASKDAQMTVRKQVIQSLSALLDTYKDNLLIQSSWLSCILPMVQDPDTGVQSKVLSVLEEKLLQKIFASSKEDWENSFNVLRVAASGEFFAHQRYLQKAFSMWKAEKKLRPQQVNNLEKYINTEWEDCVWFYLSYFSAHCNLPPKISNICVVQFQKLTESKSFPSYMKQMLKVLKNCLSSLPSDSLLVVKNVTETNLNSFSVPVSLIFSFIQVLFKSYCQLEINAEFSTFSSTLVKKCEECMIAITSNKPPSVDVPTEELLGKCFSITQELCQLNESLITPNVLSLLKMYSGCTKPTPALTKILTANVRGHAFAALGKICLQDEFLARELLPIFAQELLASDFDIVRNNVVIILIEMCKRYTSLADKYVPLISLCFKDRLFLIRYQTIVLMVNLLQEGYIKWRGALFFCLLSTLNDQKEEIQELGRYSLSSLLQDKKKTLFSEHFVDSIFVFNGFSPPDNPTLGQTVKDLDRFAMKGEIRRDSRMHLYKFLLESMDVKERAYLVKSICEILMNIAEAVYAMDATTECIIRDCFAILTCKEIRAFNIEQITEEVDETQEKEFSKTELETRKIVIIDPVVPVIASLRTAISNHPSSDLAHDIIIFLKELLVDFRDTLRDILAIDKVLLNTVELEIRNDAERERAEKRLEKEPKEKRSQPASSKQANERNDANIEEVISMLNDVSVLKEGGAASNGPQTEQSSSRQSPRQSGKTVSNEKSPEKEAGSPRQSPSQSGKTVSNEKSPEKEASPPRQSPRQSRKTVSNEKSPEQGPSPPRQSTRQSGRRKGKSAASPKSSNPTAVKIPKVVSVASIDETEMQRMASTPRVVLKPVRLPRASKALNISAIEKADEPMNVDVSEDEDLVME